MAAESLGHCKICDLPDFRDPELRELIRDVYRSDMEAFGEQEFPVGREYRKYWEVCMTLRAFDQLGVLREDAEVLGVGAGHEATIYWLTGQVGKVVATDLYGTDDPWSDTDSASEMLTDPGKYWDGPWNPDRLDVRHMSALELDFPDDTFDGVFSSSSIEHFGEWADIRRSVEEIYRVLRPGGIACLSTEFRLEGPTAGWPGVLLFDEAELRALLLDGLWWDPATPLDTRISQQALNEEASYEDALADIEKGIRGWSTYPHVVLRSGQFLWTSVHIALVKSRDPAAEWRRRGRRPGAGVPPSHTSLPQPPLRVRAMSRLGRLIPGRS